LRRSFIDDFGVPAERVRSIGAGINLERPPEYFPGKDYGKKEILFIGIDFVRKGGWELLRAFRTLRERFPEAQLHIVGPRQLTIPSELHHGVQYHGFLRKTDPADGARLQGLFRTSSLFVMPSLYEPFGIAPLEAMAYQLPCVLTNGWALKEMVTPGETGELVECGNADDLADKLTRLWASPGKLREMGETARKRVLEHHTWDKVVARLKHAVSAVGPASKVQR
jgi:glycosyltransferase involved in cell wall biosynthesis